MNWKNNAKHLLVVYGGDFFARRWAPRTHVFVAAMPKSGSTLLQQSLVELTGFSFHNAVQCYWDNEQDIIESEFLRFVGVDTVSKQHTRATRGNLALLLKYGIRPVVLVRNIFDVLVSHRDHLDSQNHRVPTGFVHPNYFSMTPSERMRYIIEVHLPWFLSFYVSWIFAPADVCTLWVTYEELVGSRVEVLRRVLKHYEMSVPDARISEAVKRAESGWTRLNVGRKGRGRFLSHDERAMVLAAVDAWGMDRQVWRRIGIP